MYPYWWGWGWGWGEGRSQLIDLFHRCGRHQRTNPGLQHIARAAIWFWTHNVIFLIHAPYTHIVVFWHISIIPPTLINARKRGPWMKSLIQCQCPISYTAWICQLEASVCGYIYSQHGEVNTPIIKCWIKFILSHNYLSITYHTYPFPNINGCAVEVWGWKRSHIL